MYLYIYNKLNKEFIKTEVKLEKETSNLYYIKYSEYKDRIENFMRRTGEFGIYDVFNRVIRKDELPIVSMGYSHQSEHSSIYGTMVVLSESELSLEEVKNLLNREVNLKIQQQEKIIRNANEKLSELNQISTDVSGLDEIIDLDNEEEREI